MIVQNLYAVYHETVRPTSGAQELYDGLLLVAAASEREAKEIVRRQMGTSYNDCLVRQVNVAYGLILEFWRTPPTRPPARFNQRQIQAQEEIAA